MAGHRKWADVKAELLARLSPEERAAYERRRTEIMDRYLDKDWGDDWDSLPEP